MDLKSLVATIFAGALSRQGVEELKAWTPWVTDTAIRISVARLPVNERERFDEEWRAHLADVPGEIGKLFFALGCIIGSVRMSVLLNENLSSASVLGSADRLLGMLCFPTVFLAFESLILFIRAARTMNAFITTLVRPSRPICLFEIEPMPLESHALLSKPFETLLRSRLHDLKYLGYFSSLKLIGKRMPTTLK